MNQLKVYLAASYGRRDELNRYRDDLDHIGVHVTSRWLTEAHEGIGEHAMNIYELATFAEDDLADIDAADILICFTEAPDTGPARGGRHCEYTYALKEGKPIIVVGYIENVFYALAVTRPHIQFFARWSSALETVAQKLLDYSAYRPPHQRTDAIAIQVLKNRITTSLTAARSREPLVHGRVMLPASAVWTLDQVDQMAGSENDPFIGVTPDRIDSIRSHDDTESKHLIQKT